MKWLAFAMTDLVRVARVLRRTFLNAVALLKPKSGARISVDDREDLTLEL